MNTEEVRYEMPSPTIMWAETLIGTLLIPIIGFALHRQDPLFLQAAFPWLIFPPLLFGIRYGFVYGFSSALLIALLMVVDWRLASDVLAFPYQYALAAIVVGMISGQFADVWLRRLGRMQLFNDYSASRLAEFTRSYRLLKISHNQLEERLAGQTHNPHAALAMLRRQFANISRKPDVLRHHAREILEFLETHSQVQQASLYEVFANERLDESPLATLGSEPFRCTVDHPMVRACLEDRELVSLRSDDTKLLERQQRQNLLAIVPLVDVGGHIWAVVAIFSMPFITFHNRNLGMLAVLGGSLGDMISDAARQAGQARPDDASGNFRSELSRWLQYVRRYKIDATLVGIRLAPRLSSDDAEVRVDQWLFDEMRTLDVGVCLRTLQGGRALLILMPLTGASGVAGYRKRIQLMLEDRLGTPQGELPRVFYEKALTAGDDADAVFDRACEECGVAPF